MPYYRQVGEIPPKRHTQFRKPDGGLYAEELMGAEGFSADSALLYHAPPADRDRRLAGCGTPPADGRGPPTTRCCRGTCGPQAGPRTADAVTGRQLLLANDDVRHLVRRGRPAVAALPQRGRRRVRLRRVRAGVVETVFGALTARQGDYVIIPTSTTTGGCPTGDDPLRLLVMEATGHIGPPRRYLSARGQFLEHAPYCERDLRGPAEPLLVDAARTSRCSSGTGAAGRGTTYAHHPFDVVGWDGCLYPWAFNIRDFEPITGRVHQPPPVHQTFEGPSFVVCSFVPRKVDYHPLAIPVPYNHANVDSDEVLFYAGGDYEARKGSGIGQGSISLHPGGFTHGPQPGAVERASGAEQFDEHAVMVDTFRPLVLAPAGLACEDPGYAWTWSGRH